MVSSQEPKLSESRVAFLKALLPETHQPIVAQLANNNSPPSASISEDDAQKVWLANDLARLTNEQPLIVKPLLNHAAVKSLRDVALNFNDNMLEALVVANARPDTPDSKVSSPVLENQPAVEKDASAVKDSPKEAPKEEIQQLVKAFQKRLFHEETSAVLSRMVREDEIPIATRKTAPTPEDVSNDEAVKNGVIKFFNDNQPTFNIRQQSILLPLADPKSFEGIDEEKRPAVSLALKKLQTTQALAQNPEAMPKLFKANLNTAFQVSSIPQANFLAKFADTLGGREAALQIHTQATNTRIRNDEALVHMHTTLRGSGLAAIDGNETRLERVTKVQNSPALPPQANLEQLFGSLDYCACSDCTSITSPAAYFVELLEFLRSNNLDPDSEHLGAGWANTPLEKLLRRRPDLANLELTCANTNTVLPYIDLANEVMESFVVHLDEYKTDENIPKQSDVDAFNIDPDGLGEGGSSAELLAEPQNTNYNAYCILKNAVYPAVALPFNQPLEQIRLFLGFLKTSKEEIGEVFRENYIPPTSTTPDIPSHQESLPSGHTSNYSTPLSTSDSCPETDPGDDSSTQSQSLTLELQSELSTIHDLVLQRANDAEPLMSQEEYIIITKQAFWPKRYFDIRHGTTFTTKAYQTKIGVLPIYKYWGVDYASVQDMLSIDETTQTGLTFVKKQFLPRSGILYADLANLLKTQFINPNLPTGKSLVTLQSIKFSYMFLMSLIDHTARSTKDKFKPLITFLDDPANSPLVSEEIKKLLTTTDQETNGSKKDCGHRTHPKDCDCRTRSQLHHWIYKHFEKVGRTIVLESGQGPRMPWEADLIIRGSDDSFARLERQELAHPHPPSDQLLDPFPNGLPEPTASDQIIAHLGLDGRIVANNGFLMARVSPSGELFLPDGKPWASKYGTTSVWLRRTDQVREDGGFDAVIYRGRYIGDRRKELIVTYLPVQDDCDLNKVRLRHLDGSSVTEVEYDRIHRFLRLWKKLGWSMQELDCALRGLGAIKEDGSSSTSPNTAPTQNTPSSSVPSSLDVDWSAFQDGCISGNCGSKHCKHCSHDHHGGSSGGGSDSGRDHPRRPKPKLVQDITPGFLHQVKAVNKLVPLTGLSLLQVLAFWTNIDTYGDASLYAQLFLTHNIIGTDIVFKPDTNGNYLATSPSPKTSDHIPVLLAAFRLKADGLDAIISLGKIPDELTLENVSAIYRYSLLASVLSIKPTDLALVSATFDSPWTSAQAALDLVQLWNRVSNAGFSLQQLAYVTKNIDNAKSPIGPTQTTILKTTKTLYDGLNDIDAQHPDVVDITAATAEALTAKVQLFFGTTVAAQIESFLNGSMIFSTNAPNGLTVKFPDDLKDRVKYASGDSPKLQIFGQLTPDDVTKLKSLTTNTRWSQAIDRLAKQAHSFFNATLAEVFPNVNRAKEQLLVGDVIPRSSGGAASSPNAAPDPNTGETPGDAPEADGPQPTAPGKRFFFLQHFLPFLRRKLAVQLISDTMGSVSSLPADVTSLLLSSVLVVKDSNTSVTKSALTALGEIHQAPSGQSNEWNGFLLVSTTDTYTFSCMSIKDDEQPPDIILDNQRITFDKQQPDPTNIWFASSVNLLGGRTYSLKLLGQPTSALQWMTARSVPTTIPANALLPDYSIKGTADIFAELIKAGIVINGFNLSAGEISYLQTNGAEFGQLDFNALTLVAWKRLEAYTTLRKSIPSQSTTLIDLFKWVTSPDVKDSELLTKINATTGWEIADLAKLCSPQNFNLGPPHFKNEINLVKLQKALKLAGKIGIDIDKLFKWAEPSVKFWPSRAIAQDIRNAVRATMRLTDWESAVKPLFDSLRKSQSAALSAYLTVQPDLVAQGVVDSDSLFEFFLIDVNMGSCLKTARLKQATSSVQQFIQRCLLGLEDRTDGKGVGLNELDRERWSWMQRYRVWEAGRKVFLYPENWIVSSLRDDKSPIYEELESALLQKDITSQTITDAIKGFLYSVDEVANLEIIGTYLQNETITVDDGLGQTTKQLYLVHLFGRSRRSPYFFFYRYYDMVAQNWAPWQQMQVDIPNYEMVNSRDQVTGNGTYLVPFISNGRLLVAIPQLTKKTMPAAVDGAQDWNAFGAKPMGGAQPTDYWELKMGYSELRNGKWTQKVTANQAFYENPLPKPLPEINSYQFIPRTIPAADGVGKFTAIDCVREGSNLVGRFAFDGALLTGVGIPPVPNPNPFRARFHYVTSAIGPGPQHLTVVRDVSSLQAEGNSGELTLFGHAPSVTYGGGSFSWPKISYSLNTFDSPVEQPFGHQFVHELIGQVSATNSIDSVYAYFQTITDTEAKNSAFGQDDSAVYSELKRPNSLYNWEVGFHAPMALADSYLKTQQFDLALKMLQYVFNPFSKGTGPKRFWKWPPFREVDSLNSMEKLFNSLRANTPDSSDGQINQWRDNPFSPHVIARLRPTAYMKWAAMKYIETLIAYGDYYFTQNTLEMIPMAIQCYVLASHVYGPRGQKIPPRGKKRAQTYKSLGDSWDPFGNAMVQLELMFPYSNQTDLPFGQSNGVVGLANIFGFATQRYFCIPDNPQLTALRDTIDDRLFKIRHCQDIFGNVQHLPLYEPPIDPSLLVAAAAQGLSIASVLNDLDTTLPNYRFTYLLGKALELCGELKSLGAQLLSAQEKRDVEALALLRQSQESKILAIGMDQKKMSLDEAQKTLDSLTQSRMLPVYRMQHYLQLLGLPVGGVPTPDSNVVEIAAPFPEMVEESGLKLITSEKTEVDKASAAADWQRAIGILETIASVFHVLPTITGNGEPLGVGVSASWGFANLANAVSAVARGLQVHAADLTYQSQSAARTTGFIRGTQDRALNANSAAYEIKNIDKQILAQNIRVAIADHEILTQQQIMDNSAEINDFLKNKYTNVELYQWLQGGVQTLYYQLYSMAHAWAKKAEQSFRVDRGLDSSNFIQFGYWESAYGGMLSGERLFLSLKKLEEAYTETRGYDFEVTKNISLRQVSPLSLLQLRDSGSCEFSIPELLYDMDFPGHYHRKIKSVAVTVPCIVGPYSSLNCTLRLLSHKYRTEAKASSGGDYAPKVDEDDERFRTNNVPVSAIAVSTAQADTGVFALSFHDERLMPFEGAGAISDWHLELPDGFRHFDYASITDVVLQIRYTSKNGGASLASAASQFVATSIKTISDVSTTTGLFALFDVKHEFASSWYQAMQPPGTRTERVFSLKDLNSRLPVYTKGRLPKNILASDVLIVTDAALTPASLTLSQGGGLNTAAFGKGSSASFQTMSVFAARDLAIPIDSWTLTIKDVQTEIETLLVLVRYSLR